MCQTVSQSGREMVSANTSSICLQITFSSSVVLYLQSDSASAWDLRSIEQTCLFPDWKFTWIPSLAAETFLLQLTVYNIPITTGALPHRYIKYGRKNPATFLVSDDWQSVLVFCSLNLRRYFSLCLNLDKFINFTQSCRVEAKEHPVRV